MLAGMIRAFPGLALVGVCMPSSWWAIEYVRRNCEVPSVDTQHAEQAPLIQVLAGALGCGAVAWLISSIFCGFSAWPAWLAHSAAFNDTPAPNEISLRFLVTGGETTQRFL